jgi:hypothetical protein
MPQTLAPVWELQSVCQDRSTWLPARSQAAKVGMEPSRTARRATSWPSPSICRNSTPGGQSTSWAVARRRTRRKNSSSSLTARTLLITPATPAIATATTTEVAKECTCTPGMA